MLISRLKTFLKECSQKARIEVLNGKSWIDLEEANLRAVQLPNIRGAKPKVVRRRRRRRKPGPKPGVKRAQKTRTRKAKVSKVREPKKRVAEAASL